MHAGNYSFCKPANNMYMLPWTSEGHWLSLADCTNGRYYKDNRRGVPNYMEFQEEAH